MKNVFLTSGPERDWIHLVDLSIPAKGDNFCDFLFALLHI